MENARTNEWNVVVHAREGRGSLAADIAKIDVTLMLNTMRL